MSDQEQAEAQMVIVVMQVISSKSCIPFHDGEKDIIHLDEGMVLLRRSTIYPYFAFLCQSFTILILERFPQ
uniref:Uncharacterized protein n=1 Tax=Solanum tuberosum TaxID=4113 RepID=M1ARD5_SOLTU